MSVFLDDVQLNKVCPSIFALGGSFNTSDKYGFIPTINVVNGLRDNGFFPVMAGQSRTRVEEKKNHTKHIMRFRHKDAIQVGGVIPEIVLVNSHDGSTSYQLRAGVYRLVCSNGMIVGNDIFCRRVKHQGCVVDRVVEAANDLIEVVPISVKKAIEWQQIELNPKQKIILAESAMSMKWQADSKMKPESLLVPKRSADTKNDLWTTFNVIQENVIRGGIRYRTEEGQRQTTRPVNSVGENVRLNTALWMLTEKMVELI